MSTDFRPVNPPYAHPEGSDSARAAANGFRLINSNEPVGMGAGSQLQVGGMPYLGEPDRPNRSNRCKAKDDTCMGWRTKGSDFCGGHLGIKIGVHKDDVT